MSDSSSYTSLFELIEDHLSKTNITENDVQGGGPEAFKLPRICLQRGQSDTGLPSTSSMSSSMRFPMPRLTLSDRPTSNAFTLGSTMQSPQPDLVEGQEKPALPMSDCSINEVLAIQLSNMFKAKEAREAAEKKKQEELESKRKVKMEESPKMEESTFLIDLMPAVIRPGQAKKQLVAAVSSASSMESLVLPDTTGNMEDEEIHANSNESSRSSSPKPIKTDMTYILKEKICGRAKCSEFGKVLCARYRPVAAPYFREHVDTGHIKVFDFSTPSPDDINKERLMKPGLYPRNNLTLFDMIMQSIAEEQKAAELASTCVASTSAE